MIAIRSVSAGSGSFNICARCKQIFSVPIPCTVPLLWTEISKLSGIVRSEFSPVSRRDSALDDVSLFLVSSLVGATAFNILSIVNLFCIALYTAVEALLEPHGNDISNCNRQSSQQSTEHRSHRHDEYDGLLDVAEFRVHNKRLLAERRPTL